MIATFKYRPQEQALAIEKVLRARRREGGYAGRAFEELIRWFCFSVLFSLIPFVLRLWIQVRAEVPIRQINWALVFDEATLLFVGIFICGTVIERLHSFHSKRSIGRTISNLCLFFYYTATILLSVSYYDAITNSAGGGGGISAYKLLIAGGAVCVLLLFGGLIYWTLHYRQYKGGVEHA